VIQRKANSYRLRPTYEKSQQTACRLVYNREMKQRRDWCHPGRKFQFVSLDQGWDCFGGLPSDKWPEPGALVAAIVVRSSCFERDACDLVDGQIRSGSHVPCIGHADHADTNRRAA
jgi:hypothetical protein